MSFVEGRISRWRVGWKALKWVTSELKKNALNSFLGPCAEGLVDIGRHCDDKAKSSIMIAITDGLWSIYRDIMTLWVQTSLENVYSDIKVTPSNRLLISTLQDLLSCPFDQLLFPLEWPWKLVIVTQLNWCMSLLHYNLAYKTFP